MNLEGIVLNKILQKEKDLLVKVLLRSGYMIDLYFYGAQGGGQKRKSTLIEIGHHLSFTIRPSKNNFHEINNVKEYQLKWEPKNIRYDISAFYCLCLMSEMIMKLAPVFNHESEKYEENENHGLFRVLSNGIFYLDQSLDQKKFSKEIQLSLFLVKLIIEQGIFPNLSDCHFCHEKLTHKVVHFLVDRGAFSCSVCTTAEDQRELMEFLLMTSSLLYKDWEKLSNFKNIKAESLFYYFCHHYQLSLSNFNSSDFLFKI